LSIKKSITYYVILYNIKPTFRFESVWMRDRPPCRRADGRKSPWKPGRTNARLFDGGRTGRMPTDPQHPLRNGRKAD
jgi:hypothetical protein